MTSGERAAHRLSLFCIADGRTCRSRWPSARTGASWCCCTPCRLRESREPPSVIITGLRRARHPRFGKDLQIRRFHLQLGAAAGRLAHHQPRCRRGAPLAVLARPSRARPDHAPAVRSSRLRPAAAPRARSVSSSGKWSMRSADRRGLRAVPPLSSIAVEVSRSTMKSGSCRARRRRGRRAAFDRALQPQGERREGRQRVAARTACWTRTFMRVSTTRRGQAARVLLEVGESDACGLGFMADTVRSRRRARRAREDQFAHFAHGAATAGTRG